MFKRLMKKSQDGGRKRTGGRAEKPTSRRVAKGAKDTGGAGKRRRNKRANGAAGTAQAATTTTDRRRRKTFSLRADSTGGRVDRDSKRAKTIRRSGGSGATSARNSARSSVRNVKLVIHKIECIKTTREVDKDEIVLTAIKTMGKVTKKNGRQTIKPESSRGKTINAGKFKKGTTANYAQPKTIASFGLGASNLGWPRQFPVQLIALEKDSGNMKGLIDTLIDKFDDAAARHASAAVTSVAVGAAAATIGAGAAAGSFVPIVGTAIGAAAGAGVMAISKAIRNASEDDVFPPRNVLLTLDRKPRSVGPIGNKKTATFEGHKGKYKVTYSWSAGK